ncbi:MAG: response regulator, partial [Pseudomonadota bacterium]
FDPERVEFRYRLPTFSDEWNSLGTSRRLNLTELPPGRFPVEVLARNYLGDWQETPTRLELEVPPFWHEQRTTRLWALLLLFIALGIGVRWWNRRLIQRAQRLQREVDERTEQLRQIFSRRSEFFANLSHELRTPLTLLLGPLSDALADQSTLSKSDMQIMFRSADRMKRLVDQMLDLQKIDAGQVQLKLEPTELQQFIQSVIEPFELLARQSDVRIELNASQETLLVDLDRLQFEKVLLNLLSNAFKVSPSGSVIELRLSREDDLARIEVLDCGPGIPAGSNERIFNRFHQEPGSYTARSEGTGIGLSLVKELMELHGGRVEAQNRESGGARLTCDLPLLKRAVTTGDDYTHDPSKPGLTPSLPQLQHSATTVEIDWSIDSNRRTILVVEDNAELRRYIREILEPHYQVIHAEDGADGLQAARRYLPDVILSDVMMPTMDGFEMARILRNDAETECIPLLYLTARGSEHDEVEGLSIGADDYLTKPFSRAVLLARIRSIFETRRRLSELNALRPAPTEPEPFQSAERIDLLNRSRQIIEDHLEDSGFGVESLAGALHMSRSQLFRKLKTEHGLLARDLIREVRLDKAALLLRTTDASITEVTYAVGFPSLANFSRAFRERYQIPPSKYRKSC